MKKQSFALTFIGSITLGWLTRSGVSAVSVMPAAKTSLTQPERTSRIDQTKNTREAEFKTFIKRVPTLSDEDRVAFSKNLAPQDRAILIENLLDEGDPSGNSYDFDLMIDSIIEIWATEDFEGAWVWTQKLAKDSYRRSISGQLINILEKKDPNLALALFSPLPQNLWVKSKSNCSEAPVTLFKVVHNGLIREWVYNSSENQTVVGNFLFSAVRRRCFDGGNLDGGIKL